MTGAMQTFNNPLFGDLRMFMIDGAPWFVAVDVARALGYDQPDKAVARHVEDDDRTKHTVVDIRGRKNTANIINESGLYSLILSSKLPRAKEFKHWVTSEVLPAIRATGTYSLAPEAEQRAVTRDDYIRAASIVGSCKNERMPVVLKLLEAAGLEVPTVVELAPYRIGRDTEGMTANAILKARANGIGLRTLGYRTGISHVQLDRIVHGKSKPKLDRAELICKVVEEMLSELDEVVDVVARS